MSEKQYTFECNGNECQIFENGFWLKIEEIVDLLNEKEDTIQSLQKDILEMIDSHQSHIEMESETHSEINDIIRTQRRKIFRLEKENEELKEEIRTYPINEQYAEEIMQQNQKLRIERNDLRIENKKLKKKLECCEYSNFLNELDAVHEKIDKGDLSNFSPLKENNQLKDDLYYWQCKYYRRDYEHKTDMCTRCNCDGLLNYCLKDKCDKMVKSDYEVIITEFENGTSIGWKKRGR